MRKYKVGDFVLVPIKGHKTECRKIINILPDETTVGIVYVLDNNREINEPDIVGYCK
jgi:hypothetical protein